jgi:hypothetical protein
MKNYSVKLISFNSKYKIKISIKNLNRIKMNKLPVSILKDTKLNNNKNMKLENFVK